MSSALELTYQNRWQNTGDGLRAYKRVLRVINIKDYNLHKLTSERVDELREILSEQLGFKTVNRHIANLKTVLRDNGFDIICEITSERRKVTPVFTPDLTAQILKAIQKSSLKHTRKLSYLYPILLYTRIGLSECLALTAVNLTDKGLKIPDKKTILLDLPTRKLIETVISENMFKGCKNYTFSKLFKRFSPYGLNYCKYGIGDIPDSKPK